MQRPNNGTFTIVFSILLLMRSFLQITEKDEHQVFLIYNWLGEKVMESEGNIINVSQLSSGIYMLKTGLQTLKFVKQ